MDGTTGAVSAIGSDLKIEFLGSQHDATVKGWFSSTTDLHAQLKGITDSNYLNIDAGLPDLMKAMAAFEASYATAHGGAKFDPTLLANSTITDPAAVLAAVARDWHH